ncbi:MAG: DegV family EDD domain-containing protein [Lysobacter sp.]|nr:DegV family EDD domain-containing protein [Lysobacter sp.]
MNTPVPDIPGSPDAPASPGRTANAPAARRTDASTGPLTAPALRRALIAGARRVIAARDGLNRINVFPVADGDTGNNLAFTLGSVLNGALSRRSRHIGELLRRIGDDAIDGARGNSGAILAQFLHGVAEHARSQPVLDAATLAAAVRHGADAARGALAQPVEGTILSVIDSFADAMQEAAGQTLVDDVTHASVAPKHGDDPRGRFARALAQARIALARTPQQMALLQKAGVVDAGAQGFVDLLEGIAEFVDGGPRAMRVHAPLQAANESAEGHEEDAHPPHDEVDPERRWCTECLLIVDRAAVDAGERAAIDRAEVRAALEAIGADSMVLAGGGTRMRVHAHVGAPQQLFDACARFATVEGMKADDMLLQSRSAERARAVAVVTDSAADVPEAIVERHALHVVPVRVNLDGRDYLDKVGLSTAEFYRRMAASQQLPRTSQPPPGDFRRSFDFLAAHHPQVVYVGLSRAVSGTLQSAEHAAVRGDAAKLHVFDSVNAAGGQALLAWRAAELADAGADVEAILRELERLRPLTLTWAMARDITHAVRGGRIPAWAEPAVRFTGLTPVAKVTTEGKLGVAGGLFAKAGAPEAFARYVARRVRKALGPSTRLRAIVGHCDAREDGERLLAALRERLDFVEAHLVETGPAIGAHAGRGTLVASVQPFAG